MTHFAYRNEVLKRSNKVAIIVTRHAVASYCAVVTIHVLQYTESKTTNKIESWKVNTS